MNPSAAVLFAALLAMAACAAAPSKDPASAPQKARIPSSGGYDAS